MSEQSERELAQAIRELRETVGENTAAIRQLTDRVGRLDKTMERVNVRLASKLDVPELTSVVQTFNERFERIEEHVGLAG